MTLLRDRPQLTAIKTLVIAVGELRNYHVARAASRRAAPRRYVVVVTSSRRLARLSASLESLIINGID